MLDQFSADIMIAMKARDKVRLEALRYVKKLLLDNKTAVKPKDELDVVIAYSKQLKESLESFPAGSELLMKTEQEIAVLDEYLPKPLSEEQVVALIQGIKAKDDSANFGAVMKELAPLIKGKFEGKRATDLVKQVLA